MKMIGHQAIGMHLPAGLLAAFGQSFDKAVAVLVVFKDSFAAVAAIHEMIDGAGILEAELARHGTTRCQKSLLVSIVMTDPFSRTDPFSVHVNSSIIGRLMGQTLELSLSYIWGDAWSIGDN